MPKNIIEIVDQWGRDRAHAETKTVERLQEATEKLASVAGIAEGAGRLAKHVMKTPTAKRMAIGAGTAAAANVVGNRDAGVGNTIGAAATGALAGRYAKPAVKALASHPSAAGQAFKKGLK